jgi:hypothetical protein
MGQWHRKVSAYYKKKGRLEKFPLFSYGSGSAFAGLEDDQLVTARHIFDVEQMQAGAIFDLRQDIENLSSIEEKRAKLKTFLEKPAHFLLFDQNGKLVFSPHPLFYAIDGQDHTTVPEQSAHFTFFMLPELVQDSANWPEFDLKMESKWAEGLYSPLGDDVAIIELSGIELSPSQWAETPPEIGSTIYLAGFPSKTEDRKLNYDEKYEENIIEDSDGISFYGSIGEVFSASVAFVVEVTDRKHSMPIDEMTIFHSADGAPGTSGAAMFDKDGLVYGVYCEQEFPNQPHQKVIGPILGRGVTTFHIERLLERESIQTLFNTE